MLKKLCAALLFLPILVFAAETPQFKEGVEYRRLSQATPQKNPRVQEFFSYGCPWCYKAEPELKQWLSKKPANVSFQRIPATFNPVYERYARAYYTLQAMGEEEKLSPVLFAAVQDERRNFNSAEDIANYLGPKGLNTKQFLEIFSGSPGLEAKISEGANFVKQYEVLGIPAVVVNGTYITDSRMTNGDAKKMFEVVSFLLKKPAA